MQEAVKKDEKKNRMDLLPPDSLEEIAKVFTFGASKYAANNWCSGFEWHRIYGSLLRHINAFWQGEDYDEEGNLHLACCGCNILMLLAHYLRKIGIDDRIKVKPTNKPFTKGSIIKITKIDNNNVSIEESCAPHKCNCNHSECKCHKNNDPFKGLTEDDIDHPYKHRKPMNGGFPIADEEFDKVMEDVDKEKDSARKNTDNEILTNEENIEDLLKSSFDTNVTKILIRKMDEPKKCKNKEEKSIDKTIINVDIPIDICNNNDVIVKKTFINMPVAQIKGSGWYKYIIEDPFVDHYKIESNYQLTPYAIANAFYDYYFKKHPLKIDKE